MKRLGGVLALLLSVQAGAIANDDVASAQSLPEKRLQSVLSASPSQILKMRKSIQDVSAARRSPLQTDYDESISQDILDLEDIFDVTLEPGDLAPKVFISRFQSTAVSFVEIGRAHV